MASGYCVGWHRCRGPEINTEHKITDGAGHKRTAISKAGRPPGSMRDAVPRTGNGPPGSVHTSPSPGTGSPKDFHVWTHRGEAS